VRPLQPPFRSLPFDLFWLNRLHHDKTARARAGGDAMQLLLLQGASSVLSRSFSSPAKRVERHDANGTRESAGEGGRVLKGLRTSYRALPCATEPLDGSQRLVRNVADLFLVIFRYSFASRPSSLPSRAAPVLLSGCPSSPTLSPFLSVLPSRPPRSSHRPLSPAPRDPFSTPTSFAVVPRGDPSRAGEDEGQTATGRRSRAVGEA
jgi:hypothetical protein